MPRSTVLEVAEAVFSYPADTKAEKLMGYVATLRKEEESAYASYEKAKKLVQDDVDFFWANLDAIMDHLFERESA